MRTGPLLAALCLSLAAACSGNAPAPDTPNGDSPKAEDGDGGGGEPKPQEPKPEEPEPKTADLSSEEAVRAAYKEQVGKELHEDDCVGQTGVKGVVLIGGFAHDRGCRITGGFVNGKYIDEHKLMSEGLALVGWKELGSADRTALAPEWAERVLFHWGGDFVKETNKAFDFKDTPAFAAPATTEDGETVVVTAWISLPPGMQDIDAYEQIELRFAPDGTIARARKDSFSVDGSRVR